MRRGVQFSLVLVLLGAILATLPACSGINRPFAREKSWLGTRDPEAPPVAITAMEGLPEATAARLAGQMYTESRRRGFSTTVQDDDTDGFIVTGVMNATPTAEGTTIVYVWDVWDPSRRYQHRITGRETIPGAAYADPWNAVDDSAMQRIASQTSEQLAGFISQMGYEIRMASVPPPASMLSDAGDSITTAAITGSLYDTQTNRAATPDAYGLADIEPPLSDAGTLAHNSQATSGAASSALAYSGSGETAAAAQSAANESAGQEPEGILPTAIVVPTVVGASREGNSELAQAMRFAMSRSGLPVVAEEREGALTIVGEVSMDPPAGSEQTVNLNWRVLAPNGALIGTIAQSNQVPSGSLDQGWGENALYAAEAAAGGIFELLSGG